MTANLNKVSLSLDRALVPETFNTLLKDYFEKFGHKGCCFQEMTMYFDQVEDPKEVYDADIYCLNVRFNILPSSTRLKILILSCSLLVNWKRHYWWMDLCP